MVDFNKIMEQRRAAGQKALEAIKDQPTKIRQQQPSYLDRINHLIEFHLGEMTEWETSFCYSNKHYIKDLIPAPDAEDLERILTLRVKNKIKELEDTYCGSFCHALNKARIAHG